MSEIDMAGPHAFSSSALQSSALLIFVGIAWGSTFSLAKIATAAGTHPLALNLWQALFGFIVLYGFVRLRGKRLPMTRRHLTFYVVAGLIGTALPGTLYFFAARHLSAGVLAITIATVPMMTLVLALALAMERLVLTRLIGISLGVVAILLIMLPDTSLPHRDDGIWVLVAVACALCYSCENIYISRRVPRGIDASTLLCGMQLMATFMTASAAIIFGANWMPSLPFTETEWAVVAMAIINAFAYGGFVHLVSTAGPVFASQTAYVVTLSGIAWGIFLFGEEHAIWIWLATAMMLVGLALVRPTDQPARHRATETS
ncbi:MAG: DMT family transporter [Hyphomicrobiaceae bacterium]